MQTRGPERSQGEMKELDSTRRRPKGSCLVPAPSIPCRLLGSSAGRRRPKAPPMGGLLLVCSFWYAWPAVLCAAKLTADVYRIQYQARSYFSNLPVFVIQKFPSHLPHSTSHTYEVSPISHLHIVEGVHSHECHYVSAIGAQSSLCFYKRPTNSQNAYRHRSRPS